MPDFKFDVNSNVIFNIDNAGDGFDFSYGARSGSSTGELSDDVKQALLQLAENAAYKIDDGRSYYDDLYNALYPPAELKRITALYTQPGTVYTTTPINSLRTNLIVTAIYSDDSSIVVASGYTLSGTLEAGQSTITVSYEGKTTTFTVLVTEGSVEVTYVYNWDFTQSLMDSVASKSAGLFAGDGHELPVQTANGIEFTEATQELYLGSFSLKGKTIEIDVASLNFVGSSAYHIRFLMNASSHGASPVGAGALIYRKDLGWSSYGYKDATHTSSSYRIWSTDGWGRLYSTDNTVNAFNGKTVKVVYGSDGHTRSLYLDDEFIATMTDIYFNSESSSISIGSCGSHTQASGDQCYNMTVSGVRVYENV